jgi:isoquinoline 1-oxidoreductase beta subunit
MSDTGDTNELAEPDSGGSIPQGQQVSQMETPESPGQRRRPRLTRRRFLIATAVAGTAGAGLVIGFTLNSRQAAPGQTKPFKPNVWLQIDADDTVTITVGRCETGQGVLTGLATLAAEELDVDWSQVRVQQAPANIQYGNQRTTGSSSMSDSFTGMRLAGAQARALLVAAAARQWGVDVSTCRTAHGVVIHVPSGRRLRYGQLTGVAAAEPLSSALLLHPKEPSQFRLIGTRVQRVDTPGKLDGSALFGMDMRLTDMLVAVVARCPVPGGTVATFDATRAKAVPGVRAVVQIASGVAVVAEHTWAALQGRQALDVTWNEGAHAGLSSARIRQQLVAQAPPPRLITDATRIVRAEYETPYQGHTPMEPLNCTARLQDGVCEIWTGTQDPQSAQAAASLASGLPLDHVSVHVLPSGGGFGRRASTDVVTEAVLLAKAVGRPTKLVWTREDDVQSGVYRPAAFHRLQATLDGSGTIQTWQHGIASQSMGSSVGAGAELPYAIPSPRILGVDVAVGVPVSIWRGAEYSYTTFAVESFIDEIAVAVHVDPYRLRRQLLSSNSQLLAIVDMAATKAGWGTPLPARWGRGMALCAYNNSNTYVAEVAEVEVAVDGSVLVHRVVCAVDCGLVVNPSLAEAQCEGSIVQGMSAALKGEITFAGGRVQQHNFDDYPLLRLQEMPKVEVYFVQSLADPAGMGEPALPPIAPAVANAIYAATGKRLRRLPMLAQDLR